MEKTIEEAYGIKSKPVKLKRVTTISGRALDLIPTGHHVLDDINFPEFTCLCPRTGHPDYATVRIVYLPKNWIIEEKSLKYYFGSFRNVGHFHEDIIALIEKDLRTVLEPYKLDIIAEFTARGGMETTVRAGDTVIDLLEEKE